MQALWQILQGIPWWVYVLFVILVRLGLQSLKPRTVTVSRVVIIPLVFLVWSGCKLYQNQAVEFPSLIGVWVICLGIGACLGAKEVWSWHIQADKTKQTITIPGNYSTIVLILAIFSLNFFWGFYYATVAPPISYWVYLADTITTTTCTGFFVGRGSVFFKKYLSSK